MKIDKVLKLMNIKVFSKWLIVLAISLPIVSCNQGKGKEKYSSVNEILIDLSKFMYVKADIAPKDIKISEIDNDNIVLNKTDNKFMQKLMLLAMTIIILITTISQFK